MAIVASYFVVSQGRVGNVSGEPLAEVIARQCEYEAAFLRAHPRCAPYHQPTWTVRHYTDRVDALPLGYERFVINADGTLGARETNWDSRD